MNITVIGSGYVGLVSGTCFAEMGNEVICVDNNEERIENLKKGIIPIYEKGLEDLFIEFAENLSFQFLESTTESQLLDCQVILIAVGTPTIDNKIDLNQI